MKNKRSKSIAEVNSFSKIPLGLKFYFIFGLFILSSNLLGVLRGENIGTPYFGIQLTSYLSSFLYILSILLILHAIWYRSRKTWAYYIAISLSYFLLGSMNIFLYLAPKSVLAGADVFRVYSIFGLFTTLSALLIYYIYSKKDYFNK